MGFSLKRALQGAVLGVAHEAGEVFDGMIAEERKQREADLALERSKQLQIHQADLIMDRERSRDEIKAAREKADRDELARHNKEIRAKVRESGLDPDSAAGLKAAAGLADENGFTALADKYRHRGEQERSHMANEENRKLQIESIRAQRGANHAAKMDAEDKNAMQGIFRQADRLIIPGARDENGRTIGDPDKDGAHAAVAWAEAEREKGRSWKAIRSDLAQITEGFAKQPDEIKKLPAIKRFDAALGYWSMTPEQRAALAKKPTEQGPAVATPGAPKTKPNTGRGFFGGGLLGGENPATDYSAGALPQQW
jgi:hypothetical protein